MICSHKPKQVLKQNAMSKFYPGLCKNNFIQMLSLLHLDKIEINLGLIDMDGPLVREKRPFAWLKMHAFTFQLQF